MTKTEIQILEFLRDGPATRVQILNELGIGFDELYPALHKLDKLGYVLIEHPQVRLTGLRWDISQ